ncbi:MAG: tRNA (adenosine(37)-N6)-threonylcarbamoyltransferase complex ATPase subunit type 1 TsaE [Thermoguttaceae bacterium]|nr:tRNA (adenosine(37)-N6)-threonylcarbamoyltransferase complex ATPase subunit type 1 TsaE [Thermoguttaceae bacterium]MDW8077320.1 tRNA (adenosine(37)-N6)-threonylcarbamoyltransferase complex ATPase subunit type 1 TsaE [Thermoguttaceae bacterium]
MSQVLSHHQERFFTVVSLSEEDTRRLGRILAELLPDGTIVRLEGTLGSGKTRLVQAVAEAADCGHHFVVSPTFVMVQRYLGKRGITHIDAYRVTSIREFLELGVEELFDSDDLVFVEWADRVSEALPAEALTIEITIQGDTERHFRIRSIWPGHEGLFIALQEAARRAGLSAGQA